MCDLLIDLRGRIIESLRLAGVSGEVAGMVAAEVVGGVAKDWAGERPYIGATEAARLAMSERDRSIRRDRARGESFRLIARRYGVTKSTVYRICSG